MYLDDILIPEKEENLEGLETLKLLLQGRLRDVEISRDLERVTKQMSPIVSTAWELGKCANCCEDTHWIDNLEHKELMKLLLSSGAQKENTSPVVSVSWTREKRVTGGKEYRSVYFNLPICQECFALRKAAKQIQKKANIISAVVFVGLGGGMCILGNSTSFMNSANGTTGCIVASIPVLMVILVQIAASWRQGSLFALKTGWKTGLWKKSGKKPPLAAGTDPVAALKVNLSGRGLRFRDGGYGRLLEHALQDAGLIHTGDNKNVAHSQSN
jgi:hypothetical protein